MSVLLHNSRKNSSSPFCIYNSKNNHRYTTSCNSVSSVDIVTWLQAGRWVKHKPLLGFGTQYFGHCLAKALLPTQPEELQLVTSSPFWRIKRWEQIAKHAPLLRKNLSYAYAVHSFWRSAKIIECGPIILYLH